MSITLKWGLITGMVYVIFSLVSNMLGLQQGGGSSAGLGILIYLLQWGGTFFTIYMGVKEIRDLVLEGAEEQWDAANIPEEQREMSRKFTGSFLNPWIMAPFVIVWVALGGMIKSLIAGSILKNEAPPTVPMA